MQCVLNNFLNVNEDKDMVDNILKNYYKSCL